MAKKREETPQSRPPLQASCRDFLFAYLLTHEDLYVRARAQLTDGCFAQDEGWLKMLWQVLGDHYNRHGSMPSKEAVISLIEAELDLNPEIATDDEIALCDSLVSTAFALEDSPSNGRAAARWLRDFLEDRLIQAAREELLLPHTPADVMQVFARLADKAAAVRAVAEEAIPVPFEDGWDEEGAVIVTTSTGLTFLDTFMDGGDARGETYGLLAPYGGGKTTVGVMITCEKAERAFNEWEANGRQGPCGRAYHFAYEDSMEEIRMRALCYLSKIPIKRLSEIVGARAYERFSTVGRYEEYERVEYRSMLQAGQPVFGERERYARAIEVLNKCWRCVYMGASKTQQGRGTGMVPEIASIVASDVSSSSLIRPDVVLADYVLAAVRRHIMATHGRMDEMRQHVVGWPGAMKHMIAVPFDTPVWSLQQLNPTANSKAAGHVMSSLDSGEGKGFPENCNFCFAIGKANRDNQATFTCDKHRRSGTTDPIVVTLQGDRARLIDSRLRFAIDPRTHMILSIEEANRVGGRAAEENRRRRSPVSDVAGQRAMLAGS